MCVVLLSSSSCVAQLFNIYLVHVATSKLRVDLRKNAVLKRNTTCQLSTPSLFPLWLDEMVFMTDSEFISPDHRSREGNKNMPLAWGHPYSF